jgi:lipopolysaccharide export system permease protein
MRTLDRYIGTAVAVNGFMVMVVLLALFLFTTFVGEAGYAGRNSYNYSDIAIYCLKIMPRQTYELFPMIALLGAMLGLGALANSSELIVMRAAGISVLRISGSVLKVGAIFVVLITIVGETYAPTLEFEAKEARAKAMGKTLSLSSRDGLWVKEGDLFIQVEKLLHQGDISHLTLYQLTESGEISTMTHAVKASYQENHWLLENVTITQFSDAGVAKSTLDEMSWKSELNPEVLGLVIVRPEHLSIRELFDYIGYLDANGLDAKPYALSLWSRILAPLGAAGMLLLAIPFVFGSLRSVSIGQRIMTGVLVGVGFYMFNNIFKRLGIIYDIPAFLSAAIPLVTLFVLWYLLMKRVR